MKQKQSPATSTANAERAESRHESRQRTLSFVSSYGIPMTLLLFIVVFSALRPDTFLTIGNFQAIIGTQAILMMLALAVTIPLAAGDFDLSIGNVAGFTMAALSVLSVTHGWSWPLAFAAAVGLGVVVGAVNGYIVVHLGVNAFIVTLGTGTVLSGLTLAITGGETIGGLPTAVESISRTSILGIPLVAYYAIVLALILWYLLEHTPAGRYVLFVNGGRDARPVDGAVDSATVIENMTLTTLRNYFTGGVLRKKRQLADAREQLGTFDVRPRDPQAPMGTLSGGNQQKVLLAKWFRTEPDVLLLHEPTQGVDIGARTQIFEHIRVAANSGTSIVIASGEHEDLAALCDRVLVFCDGVVTAEIAGAELTAGRLSEQSLRTHRTGSASAAGQAPA